MIDEQVFQKLKETMGDILPILIDAFKEDGLALLQDIQQGLGNEDSEKIRVAAHTLKSSAKNVGAMDLAEYCAEMERMTGPDSAVDFSRLAQLHELANTEMEAVQKGLDLLT